MKNNIQKLAQGNRIHPSADIHPSVVIGKGNTIHSGVEIMGFMGNDCEIIIGDNNIFHSNVRILVDKLVMGDNSVLHNHVALIAGDISIGNLCWFGQYTTLDGQAGLTIGNQVAMGFNNNVSTHAHWKHVPPGCLLVGEGPVVIEYGVWMMGANVVISSGITLRERTIVLPNAVVTKSTEPGCVYGGVPAKKLNIKGWAEERKNEEK